MSLGPSDMPLEITTTLWQLSALDRLLVRLLCPEGKLDSAVLLRAADGDRDMYQEMLCALINVQTSARRAMERYESQAVMVSTDPAGAKTRSWFRRFEQ